MSWGIRISILYLGFVALILTLAFTCFGHKTELEATDYYARELKFQEQLDAANNMNALQVPVRHIIRDRSVQLVFPSELLSADLTGTVYFLRPSDASKDRSIALMPGPEGMQLMDPGFSQGVYKMQLSFSSKGKKYYKETVITFQ